MEEGGGAFTLRLKRNFWGNDGDTKTALGVIPYVTFPTGNPFEKNQDVAFGVGFPFSCDINGKLGWGGQPQFDFVPDEEGNYDLSFFQSVVIGGTVIGNLDFYAEAVGYVLKGDDQFLVNGGLIYNVSPNVKVDVATNIGLNTPSPTRVYLGLSFRI
ncbi:MAG: transporter [Chryseotalea sp.]